MTEARDGVSSSAFADYLFSPARLIGRRAAMQTLTPRLWFCRTVAAWIALLLTGIVVSTTSAADVYFPLASGMEWIYGFQVIPLKGDTTNGVFHRKIGEAVQHNGKTYFRSHTWLEGGHLFPMDYTKLVRRLYD
jgi:hypothetical protein